MKQTIIKAYWNYEKEEKWLNEMSLKGLALTDYWWIRYVFEPCEPGEYTYRIQMLKNRAVHPESRQYIDFVESTGAQCVATYLRWAYFRKKTSEGPFELFTDIPGRIRHYRMVRAFWIGLCFLEYFVGLINIFSGLEPPISPTNIVLGAFLIVLGGAFTAMIVSLTKKIRRLKKQQRIIET